VPLHHSRQGSANILYIDFDGYISPAGNRGWGYFEALPYDPSRNGAAFDETERELMTLIWQRVAEDFSPFDVDVTTEEPPKFNTTTGRCVVTLTTTADGKDMPHSHAGGVAYIDLWGRNRLPNYSPALVYYDNLLNGREDYVAEAISHEFGHNLGLSHDGQGSSDYYRGERDPQDPTSFAPIMGTGYKNSLTQWSNGNYKGATNLEDDVAILRSHLSQVPDEDADGLPPALRATEESSTVEVHGVISDADDTDIWPLQVDTAGVVSLRISPWAASTQTNGGNLDAKLVLRAQDGSIVAIADPARSVKAALEVTLASGLYYAEVDGVVAFGASAANSDYGSMGQYTLSATLPAPECRSDADCNVMFGDDLPFCKGAPTCSSGSCTLAPRCAQDEVCLEDEAKCASITTTQPTTAPPQTTTPTSDATTSAPAANVCVDDVFRGNSAFERAATLSLDADGKARIKSLRVCPDAASSGGVAQSANSGSIVDAPGEAPADWFAVPLCAGQVLEVRLEFDSSAEAQNDAGVLPLLAVWGVTHHAQSASRVEADGNAALRAMTDASSSASFSYFRVSSTDASRAVSYSLVLTANSPCSVNDDKNGEPPKLSTTLAPLATETTTVSPPTTTTKAPTTTTEAAPASTTTSKEAGVCGCDGSYSAIHSRKKREYINFALSCPKGHVVQACVRRLDAGRGKIRATLSWLNARGKWENRSKTLTVAAGEGSFACLSYNAPPEEAKVTDRFSVFVATRERYEVRFASRLITQCREA
jgi:hypothetical protein